MFAARLLGLGAFVFVAPGFARMPDALEWSELPAYFQHLKRVRDVGADQPLLNTLESHDQRAAFLRNLWVTHVLLDPGLRKTAKSVLDADSDLLTPRYDDGSWARDEVRRR